jgi:hypothetical protein
MLNILWNCSSVMGLDRSELIYAGIINEDIKTAVVFNRCVDDALRLGGLGDVAPYCDSLATGFLDRGDNSVGASLAGSVVHDYGRAFCGECLGSDAIGCAGDDCDFTGEFAH